MWRARPAIWLHSMLQRIYGFMRKSVRQAPVEEWDLVMLKQPTGGKIINIASMVSWFGGTPSHPQIPY